MSDPKCGCSERNPIACWACRELAFKEPDDALETEDWAREVHGDPRSDDDDDLPDYY